LIMAGYGHYLKTTQKYIEIVRNSPERVRKVVLVITASALISLVFLGWIATSKIFSSLANQANEKQAQEFGSDVHSILNAFQERLDKDKGKYSTPPAYFLDKGEIPTTTK